MHTAMKTTILSIYEALKTTLFYFEKIALSSNDLVKFYYKFKEGDVLMLARKSKEINWKILKQCVSAYREAKQRKLITNCSKMLNKAKEMG